MNVALLEHLRRFVWMLAWPVIFPVFAEPVHPVFGIHVHEPISYRSMDDMGYGAVRLWDSYTTWRDVQPWPDHFDFARLDRRMALARSRGQRVLLTLGSTPQWASARPQEPCAYGKGCAAPPINMTDWVRYVSTVATRYKGQVECYETWNEVSFPSEPRLLSREAGGEPHFYSGTAAQLAALHVEAFRTIRSIDPKACVLTPSFHSSGDWIRKLDLFLKSGVGDQFDGVSFHLYFGDFPEDTVRNARNVRQVLEQQGLAGRGIWNTEVGIPFAKKRGSRTTEEFRKYIQSQMLRTYLLNLSEGIDRVYWYAWDNREFGLSDETSETAGLARKVAKETLTYLSSLREVVCRSNKDALWICDVRDVRGEREQLVWALGKPLLIHQGRRGKHQIFGSANAIPIPLTGVLVSETPVRFMLD